MMIRRLVILYLLWVREGGRLRIFREIVEGNRDGLVIREKGYPLDTRWSRGGGGGYAGHSPGQAFDQ
jgi:hypothetical protein